jgi:hypothetical protein
MGDNPWIGWKGLIAHPSSPLGGGGPGRFRSAKLLGRGITIPNAGSLGRFPDLGQIWNQASNLLDKSLSVVQDLARVDWLGSFDTTGLEGDWHRLYLVWFFEKTPTDLGAWSAEDGVPLVTITSKGYVHDLKQKPHYQETLTKFKKEHSDFGKIKVGAQTTNSFSFTGEGSASGDYDALEWFMGSYDTTVTVVSADSKTRSIKIKVVVSNISHWQSGTRLPKSFINKGLPPFLVSDAPRNAFGPGGTFKQKFIWEDTIRYEMKGVAEPPGSDASPPNLRIMMPGSLRF